MPISLSTGCFYKWSNNINGVIEICRENIQIDGMELMLINKTVLENFDLSEENLVWLKKLQHVSLHVPAKIVDNATDHKDLEEQLELLEKIYKLVDAKAIVFHITNLPKLELLNKFEFNAIIENTTTKGNINLNNFTRTIEEYKKDICLDVSHAYTWSKTEAREYATKLKDKIFQIHLSASKGQHDHSPVSTSDADFNKSIRFLKTLDKPIIIESSYNNNDIEFLKKDLEFIRGYLKNSDEKK